jgi:hypothetical protein
LLASAAPSTIESMSHLLHGFRRRVSAICLLTAVNLACACGSRSQEAGEGPKFTDLSASELLGGQSGVEGGCHDPSPVVREVGLDEDVGNFRASDVLAYASGVRAAEMRWFTLPAPDGVSDAELMTVELETIGAPQWWSSFCGSYLEIPVHYRVFSESGSIDVEATNVLRSIDGRTAHLGNVDQFPLNPDWTTRVESMLNTNGLEVLELSLTFDVSGMKGRLSVRGVGLCTVVEWPPLPCQVGVDDPVYGELVGELVQHLRSEPPRWTVTPFEWSDGTQTELVIQVAENADEVCVGLQVAPNEQLAYYVQLPAGLRVSTTDGRIDAVLPAYLAATAINDGRWSRFSFRAELTARREELGTFALPELDGDKRVVIRLSGDRESVSLSVDSLVPVSDELGEANVGCATAPAVADGLAGAGLVTPVLTGWWKDQ